MKFNHVTLESCNLGSMDTSIRVSYPCHIGVVLAIICYNFSEIAHVVVPYPCPCFLGCNYIQGSAMASKSINQNGSVVLVGKQHCRI